MNANTKLYVVVGGTAVVSLAAGATGGYFIAKRSFDLKVDALIAEEVEKTKKHFSVLLMEAKSGKPDSPADLSKDDEDSGEGEAPEDEELTEADRRAIAKGREALDRASEALTNYQGFSEKPSLDEVVHKNIFSEGADTKKKALPPRGPGGKFVPKASENGRQKEHTPYIISQEDFLLNEDEHDQRNLLYFKNEDTLIDVENNNEALDNGVVGEVNLTLFPAVPENEQSVICVRNEGLATDYEIRLMTESLTAFIGLDDVSDGEGTEETDDEHALLQD